MGTFLVFFGTLLLSIFVSMLAGLSLAEAFKADQEFIVVLFVLPVFGLMTMVIFAIVYLAARTARAFQFTAWLLVVGILALLMALSVMGTGGRTFRISPADIPFPLELLVPALITILMQWGLVRRRWLRRRGEDDLSRWPWVTTVIAGLTMLNPGALGALSSALQTMGTAGLRDISTMIASGGVIVLLLMALIEIAIRGRVMRRRQPAA